MPLVPERQFQPLGTPGQLPEREDPTQAPGWWETFGAGLRLETSIGSAVVNFDDALGYDTDFDPDYEVFDDIAGYEPHVDRFAQSFHPDTTAKIKRQIDRESEDRRTIAEAGALGLVATFTAGALDPIGFLPIGGALYRAGTSYKAATTGARMLKGAATTMGAGAIGLTASESVLQATQETRTLGESALNIGAGALLGGVLGAAAPAVADLVGKVPPVADDVPYDRAPVQPAKPAPAPSIVFDEVEELNTALRMVRGTDGNDVAEAGGEMVTANWQTTAAGGNVAIATPSHGRMTFRVTGGADLVDAQAFPDLTRRYIAVVEDLPEEQATRWSWQIDRPAPGGGSRRVAYTLTRSAAPDEPMRVEVSVPKKPGEPSPRIRRGEPGDPAVADLHGRIERDHTVTDGHEPLEPGFVKMSPEETAENFRSAGAAGTGLTLADRKLRSTLGVAEAVRWQDPLLRTNTSDEIATVEAIQRLADSPLSFQAAERGIPVAPGGAVETRIKLWQAPLNDALVFMDDAFLRYRKGRSKRFGDIARIGASDLVVQSARAGKMTYGEFRAAVSHANRNGDRHQVPEVAEVARQIRETVITPLAKAAQDAGIFGDELPDVTTAESYLMRLWSSEEIRKRPGEFVNRVAGWLIERRDQAVADVPRLTDELGAARARATGLNYEIRGMEAGQARLVRELRRRRDVLRERSRGGQAGVRRRERDVRQETAREEQVRPTPRPADEAQRELIAQIRRGGPRQKASRLVSWLVGQGGLQDEGGEITAATGGVRGRPGLISTRGMDLDTAALRATEEGFFVQTDRADIDELIEAIRDDLGGRDVVRNQDLWILEEQDFANELAEEMAADGIDVVRASNAEMAAWLNREPFVRDTPRRRGQVAEARLAVRRSLRRMRAEDEALGRVGDNLEDIDEALRAAEAQAPAVRAELETLRARRKDARAAREDLKKALGRAEFEARLDDGDLRDTAMQIKDRILGTPDGRLPYDATADFSRVRSASGRGGLRGPLRSRVFQIEDMRVEDFLENDAEVIMRAYVRTMAPDVELVREFGDADMTPQIARIQTNYAQRISAEPDGSREQARLQRNQDADIRDVSAVRDRLRGTYQQGRGQPDGVVARGGRIVKNLNYIRLLGGMTISAIPDVFRPFMVHGVTRTLRDGVVPLVRNMRAVKLARRETQTAGTALDMMLDSRTMAIADLMDDYGRHSRFERGLRAASNQFGMVSLMAPWNAFWKGFSGMVTMTRFIDAAQAWRGGKIGKKDLIAMASSGIDEATAVRIADQFDRYGETEGTVRLPNTARWDDRQAAEALRAAIVRDVDRIIVTPGQDKPLWMSDHLWSVVGQFKSFQVASVQRAILAGLQERDAGVFVGTTLMFGAGMGVYWFKTTQAGRELSDDPAKWIVEGVDRSGLSGWLFDANAVVERVTRGAVGINAALGAPPMSRFASRNLLGTLLGPTAGLIQDSAQVTGAIATGDWRQSDSNAARKMIPTQNHFLTRNIYDQVQGGLNDWFDIPERAAR